MGKGINISDRLKTTLTATPKSLKWGILESKNPCPFSLIWMKDIFNLGVAQASYSRIKYIGEILKIN